MSISLSVGDSNPISLSGIREFVAAEKSTNLKLGEQFQAFLNEPLSALPPKLSRAALQYTGGLGTWTPSIGAPAMGTASPLTFSLSAGVCGNISIVNAGPLLAYTDGFPQTVGTSLSAPAADAKTAKSIDAGPGQAYVVLELDFQLSGGLNGSYQQGLYGVSTQDAASSSISVAFYKSCTPSMLLREAIQQAFEGFVLPLHEKTLEQMAPGDYLHYNFNGNLQLGVGASIGYDAVFYAATASNGIPATAGAVTIAGGVRPEVQAGAKFCFHYDYCGTFEVLLWRDQAQRACLHLYRSSTQSVSTDANFGLALASGSSASVSVATDHVTTLLTQSMPDSLQPVFSSRVLPAAMGEVSKYVSELNSKVTSWLSHTQVGVASLDAAIQHTGSRFLLTDYTIDLGNASYPSAWKLMLEGRFLDAMQMPDSGVTLATGSGIETLFKTAAAVKLNLFGALHAAWTTSTLSESSLVYAGNNVFHLVTLEGRDVLKVVNATQSEMSLYFAAEADVSTAGSRIAPPKLHCILQATDKPSFGKAIADLVARLSSGPEIAALAGAMASTARQPHSTETLHLIFGPDAYGALAASTLQHSKPDDESKDARNYAAFRAACAATYTDNPANFEWSGRALTYALWRNAWIASNDRWPAAEDAVPDRRENAGFTSWVSSQLSEALPGLAGGSEGPARLVFYTLEAAAQFMNLCDDLRTLASQTAEYTPATWGKFVDELGHILKSDLNTDFLPAMILALAALCGGAPSLVSGPLQGLPAGTSIAVTMTYGQTA